MIFLFLDGLLDKIYMAGVSFLIDVAEGVANGGECPGEEPE
jgi:hypothetical protein